MGRRARLGLITALAGLLVPIVMFPFTQGQLPLAGFLYNVNRMEVVLYEGERPVGDVLPPEALFRLGRTG